MDEQSNAMDEYTYIHACMTSPHTNALNTNTDCVFASEIFKSSDSESVKSFTNGKYLIRIKNGSCEAVHNFHSTLVKHRAHHKYRSYGSFCDFFDCSNSIAMKVFMKNISLQKKLNTNLKMATGQHTRKKRGEAFKPNPISEK